MTRTRRTVLLGLAAAATYLAGAALSGHLNPLARRPLLDGFAPPPPYRWVEPPPNLAPINKPPLPGRYTVPVGGAAGGEGLFATRDSQASILLPAGSISAPPGIRAVRLSLEAQAAPEGASLPGGVSITGNVYSIGATLEPGGQPIHELRKPGAVTLVYPALAGPHQAHRILASTDGTRFTELPSIDSPVLQQITAHTRTFGLFAVGLRGAGGSVRHPAGEGPGFPTTAIVVAIAAVVAVAIGWLRWRARRAAAAHAARRRSAAPRVARRGDHRPRHEAPPRRKRRPGRERDGP
jgi:hypothetical protein